MSEPYPVPHFELQNGDRMPALGLGTWKSAPGEVGAAVRTALEIGYRHLDCAAIYGNEEEIGEALEAAFADGVVAREDLWVTSKLWCNRHREEDVVPALRATLADLRLDSLDLYLVHWPVAVREDLTAPESGADMLSLEERPLLGTWRGMEACVQQGLARHIGVSNYSAKKLRDHQVAERPPEVNQVEMHPYLQQPGLKQTADELGVVLTGYSPLGSADRPDTMRKDDDPVLLEDPGVAEIASEAGCTPAQVMLAWALKRGTSVIPKSTNEGRMRENLEAASVELSAAAMERLTALDRHRRYVDGVFWTRDGSPYTLDDIWDEDA